MFKHKPFFIALIALILCQSAAVHATNVPSSAQPGVVIRNFEEEKRPASKLDDSVSVGKEQSTQGLSKEKIFVLQRVVLDGSTIYTQADVDAAAQGYIGKTVSFADLNEIAQKLTKRYRDNGYLFSKVIVSPQNIEGGVVHLKAIEGRITDVKIIGTYTDANNLIHNIAQKIKTAGPSNAKDLERYLLLLDDLPGITARSLLQPSATPGGGELIITIEEDKFEGSVSADNRGSDYLGPYRGTMVGAFNSLFNLHDRTTVRGIVSSDGQELRYGDLTHEQEIGTEGFRLKGRFAVTDTKPGEELEALDLKGKSRLFDIEGYYPVIRSRQTNLNVIGGFNALNSETDLLGTKNAYDRVRSFRVGGHLDFTDSLAGVSDVDLQVTRGIKGLGATDEGTGRSRTNGKQDFIRTNISAVRVQDLGRSFALQVSASGQYSPDNLLSSEEFSIGGPDFGRAYDAGEITGDSGVAGAIELRYSRPPVNNFIRTHQFYVFYDAGKVWNDSIAAGETKQESLASAGVGVRFNLARDISGYVEYDSPLTRDVNSENNDDNRIFFSLLKRF